VSQAASIRPRRRVAMGVALVAIPGAAAIAIAVGQPFSSGGGSEGGTPGSAAPVALARVERRTLSSRTQLKGTLRFAGSYGVVAGASGSITALPAAGTVVRRGQVLYRLAGRPVVLLYGGTPAYRTLRGGLSGRDVRQLNANLVALGYAAAVVLDPTSGYFGGATKAAVKRMQAALGVKATGRLELGRAVFLPEPLRIAKAVAALATMAQPGAIVMQATSTRRHVAVALNATQQESVAVGDRVEITLPSGRVTRGVVKSKGRVATEARGSGSSTVPMRIALRNPKGVGSLDRASVQVAITTARVKRALVAPVTALVALAGGGYAVETVDARGVRRLVRVKLGLFDDAEGVVQVKGALKPGQRIVVPTT